MTRKQLDSKFKSKTLRQILHILPHRLIVYFASQCAKDAMSKTKAKNQDPRSLTAIDVAERFGNGEDFTPEHLKKTWDDANAADAARAANAASEEHYKPLLLDLIDKRLTKVEKLLIFN